MEGGNQTEPAPSEPDQSVDETDFSWEASEYIHHEKRASWYLGLAGITLLICAVLYAFLRDWFSIAVVVLMAVAVGVYGHRQPKVQGYRLSRSALTIGGHRYQLSEFGSYQVADEGAVQSLTFIPLRRFMPPVSVYFLPSDSDKILSLLGSALPREEHKPDLIDRLMKNVRF